MFCEPLEGRRLLSASLNSTTGLLTITGTDGRDRITVTRGNAGRLIVTETSYTAATKTTPATVDTHRTIFRPLQVKSILVNARGGNDFVDVSGNHERPIFFLPSTVNGGGGNDTIYGGQGKDVLNGDAGNDNIWGLGSNDLINGGDGTDKLVGGLGADSLNGGAGNDLLDARDGSGHDTIDGGANATPTTLHPGDIAWVNKGDIVSNVEKVFTLA
jgi:Ca2+-binding RTX toxin-like protein